MRPPQDLERSSSRKQIFALGSPLHDAHLLDGITAWQLERLLGEST